MTNNHVIECRCDECHNRKQAPFRFSMPDNERETFTVLMPKQWNDNVITFNVNWARNR